MFVLCLVYVDKNHSYPYLLFIYFFLFFFFLFSTFLHNLKINVVCFKGYKLVKFLKKSFRIQIF